MRNNILILTTIYYFFCVPWNCEIANAFNDSLTHPKLSLRAIEKSETTLDLYFEDFLSLKDGIKTDVNGKNIYEWLQLGAKQEDAPMCRASNHFHNPYLDWTDSGLTDTVPWLNFWCYDMGWGEYLPEEVTSNVTWATGYSSRNANATTPVIVEKNGWDWEFARLSYLAYLTGRNAENQWFVIPNTHVRNKFLAYTFQALGQVMHLLQDTASPAHVRNDFSQGHLIYRTEQNELPSLKWFGNGFEKYVKRHNDAPWFDAIPQKVELPAMRLTDLWDTDQMKPGIPPPGTATIGLAEYTNMNFFSEFTIFSDKLHNVPDQPTYPRFDNCYVFLDTIPHNQGFPYLRKYISSSSSHPGDPIEHLATAGYLFHWRETYFPNNIVEKAPVSLDDKCYQDYAEKLIPKAIGYSAALIDYFFRGKLSVSAMPYFKDNTLKYITLNIENVTETQETMTDGHFFLLFKYTPKDGTLDGSEDVFVLGAQTPPVEALAYSESVEFHIQPTETIPFECWDTVECTLAFYGTLGNEPDAVVGKVFNPPGLNILFNEEWENGLLGRNAWQDPGDHDEWATKKVEDGHLIMESTTYPDYAPNGRWNTLIVDLKWDGSQGIPITPTTFLQFAIPVMSSVVGNPIGANHALALHFSDGTIIEYSGDGRLCDWTDPDRLISLSLNIKTIITDNIYERYAYANRHIPDSLYLGAIQLMQTAIFETTNDYYFYMDVDTIRLFDTQQVE